MIPSALQIKRLKKSLNESGVRITEKAEGLIDHAVKKGDIGTRVGFEGQLRTAKTILDHGEVVAEEIVVEPDVKDGDVDILVEYEQKTYHLQVGAKNFYSSDDFFPTAISKVKEFYESLKDSSNTGVYDILYKSPEDIRAEVARLPSAPGSAACVRFSSAFFGHEKIQNKIRSKLQKASSQLGARKGPLQFNVAVIGAHSFLAAGDDTYYNLTVRELEENPRDYWNLDLVLIQSLALTTAKRSVAARLLPIRNPHLLPQVDTNIFGDTEDVQLYKIRFTVFPYHFSEPGEHTFGIRDGRLHVDGHTGPKMI